MALLYKADPVRGTEWKALIAAKKPDLPVHVWPDTGDADAVRYLAVWEPPDDMAARFPHTKIVFSVGAGVDQFDFSALPADIPLVRMLDPGITEGMVEYVTLAVLALHRNLVDYIADKGAERWSAIRLVPAQNAVSAFSVSDNWVKRRSASSPVSALPCLAGADRHA